MINPAGDAKYAGRAIGDYFERGISLQCAEQLKKVIEQQHPYVRVILTRTPGEIMEPLHHANLANRLTPDIYISLHFYAQQDPTHNIYFYYMLYNPITDFWYKPSTELALIPYNHAHIIALPTSQKAASFIAHSLKKELTHGIVHEPMGIPFRPLVGLTVPAIACEIGIQKKSDADAFIIPLAKALITQVFHAQTS